MLRCLGSPLKGSVEGAPMSEDNPKFPPGFFDSLKNLQMPRLETSRYADVARAAVDAPRVTLLDKLQATDGQVQQALREFREMKKDAAAGSPEGGTIVRIVEPKLPDDWFRAMRDCALGYEKEHGATPNQTQLELKLWSNPPVGYEIRLYSGKRETLKDCLVMEDEPDLDGRNFLNKRGFRDRFRRYYPSLVKKKDAKERK